MRTRKLFKTPKKYNKKIHCKSSVIHPQHNAWYGLVTHTSLGKSDLRHTRSKWTHKTRSRTMGRHGYLRHVKCAPGWWSGHVTNTVPAQSTRWIKRKKRKEKCGAGGGSERHGEWAGPTWVSERYAGDGAQIDALSVCCPVQLGFEKSRKEGRVTERSHGTSSHREKKNISHMKGLRRSIQMEAATHKSTRTSEHKLVGWQKSKRKNSLDFSWTTSVARTVTH